MICSLENWEEIEKFGRIKIDFLRKYLPYKNGTPTDDTIRLFFVNMDPGPFSGAFRKWVSGFGLESEGMIIAIDGKTSRGSLDGKGTAFHLISAFAAEQGIVLGQLKKGGNGGKSNEIPAIPELIDVLDCKGSVLTVDAMGCQKAVAEKIISKGADYVLALKGKQSGMHGMAEAIFNEKLKDNSRVISCF